MGALDPTIVDQLQALARAGNSQLLDRLQASFTRDTPLRLQALRAAVAARDAEAVAFNAHTLKGSAANLGATEMVATCVQIEASSPDAGPAELEALLTELEQGALRAQTALARLADAA